jgi:hypothetical protein
VLWPVHVGRVGGEYNWFGVRVCLGTVCCRFGDTIRGGRQRDGWLKRVASCI